MSHFYGSLCKMRLRSELGGERHFGVFGAKKHVWQLQMLFFPNGGANCASQIP